MRAYSISAPKASARLPGIVQGVVVQMTMAAFCNAPGVITGNRTQMVVLVWSAYSTSASASAVFSTTLHITGRRPRYSAPLLAKRCISDAMAASAEKSIVA